ncbi:SGNH/GDSL hydrolase family protein, partial [Pseudonocardia nigra]|uniref:SGNH/GDSL hydrolase family protein n=1 Tax=Pseudonocardia nigra TaxID=1921578 RepID=UPI001C5FB1C6
MSSPPQVPRMRAAARRAKAGGERFLGGLLPGASARRLQVRAFADEWAAANLEARQASGPLWIVLGDSASQGIGATTREVGYVGVVHELLRRRDAWRVVNLSRAGAGVADVLGRQLPELAALTAEEPAALVSCIIGTEDLTRHTPGMESALRGVFAALPTGSVVGTIRPTRGGMRHPFDAVIREEAERHRLRVAVLPTRPRRDSVHLDDVGHAAWATAVIAAVDSPPAEPATATDPALPIVPALLPPPSAPVRPLRPAMAAPLPRRADEQASTAVAAPAPRVN